MSRFKGVPGDDTARIAGLFAARIAAARSELKARMEASGCPAAEGWRIHEEIVTAANGSALRLRAIHRTHGTPAELEIVVSLR